MEVSQFNKQKEIDPVFNLFKHNCKQHMFNVDEEILKKYDQNNKHFSIKEISQGNEELTIIGFDCIYIYDNYQIQLEYFILNGIWKIISQNLNLEQQIKLNILLKDINQNNNLSFHQQIQFIIDKFDQHFYELNQENLLLKGEDDEIKNLNKLSLNNNILPPSPIMEIDEQQIDSPILSESIDLNQKSDCLILPVKSNRIRQDSSCSSANSLKYTEFVPPSMVSICRRRVIQSIFLHVERKKQIFEKVVNKLKDIPIEPTMYELGLEFLRLYNGIFNYSQGHTFIMSFKKRTWFLTINSIKCVECQLGESEPRSVLILQYKNKFTTVQV